MKFEDYSTLLIGASISLVTSTIILLITSIFQLFRDNKTRKWQKEDNKRNLEASILKNRISDTENFLNKLAELAKKILISERYIFLAYSKSDNLIQEMMMRDRFKHEDDSPWENPEVQLKLKKIKDQTLEKILIIPDEISFIEPDFFAQLHSLKLYDDYDATINIEMKNRFAGYLNCITQESNYYGDLYQKFNNFLDDGLENIEQEGSRLESFDVERSRFNAEIRYYLDKLLIQIMK